MRQFFEENNGQLSPNQTKLVSLMTPVIQEYYRSKNYTPEQIEFAVAKHIEKFQENIGMVLAEITIQENKKTDDAIAASDGTSVSPY